MSSTNKKSVIREKRNYENQSKDLKRKGGSLDLKEFLLKKLKNNEGNAQTQSEKPMNENISGLIRVSSSGKSIISGGFISFTRKESQNFIFLRPFFSFFSIIQRNTILLIQRKTPFKFQILLLTGFLQVDDHCCSLNSI